MFSSIKEALTPNISSRALMDKIDNTPGAVVEHNFGPLGSIYFIKPEETDFEALMSEIQKQPDLQRTRKNIAWLVDGPILSSLPKAASIPHHKLFVNSVSRPDAYIKNIIESLNEYSLNNKTLSLRRLCSIPIFNALAKGLLGMNQLTPELANAFSQFTAIISGNEDAEYIDDEHLEDAKASTDTMTDLAKNNHNLLRFMRLSAKHIPGTNYSALDLVVSTGISGLDRLSKARETYVRAANTFVTSQIPQIKKDLLDYSNDIKVFNILSLSVIEVIKERNKKTIDELNKQAGYDKYSNFYTNTDSLKKYLKELVAQDDTFTPSFSLLSLSTSKSNLRIILDDPYIHTVPANIFAGNNVKEVLATILYELASNPELLKQYRETLQKHNLAPDFSNMREVIEADKKENGLLHQMFMEGIRLRGINDPLEELRFSAEFRYYITNPMTINGTHIPADSMIAILNGRRTYSETIWGSHPEKFDHTRFAGKKDQLEEKFNIALNAFSSGPRICPAHIVTMYMATTYLAYVVTNFDLTLHAKPNQSSYVKIFLEFTERADEGLLKLPRKANI